MGCCSRPPPRTCAWSGPPAPAKAISSSRSATPRSPTGMRVRYFAAADLVEALYRGMADNTVAKIIDTLLRADLVIVDELGFAPSTSSAPNCCSASSPPPTNAASASPATGPSTPGADSSPNTPPPPPCSTGSCTTPSSSSPKARATACAKPKPQEDAAPPKPKTEHSPVGTFDGHQRGLRDGH